MDPCSNSMLSFYSLACSENVKSGPSVVSQDILILHCGLREVRLLILIFLTIIIYYNFYVQVKEAPFYSKPVEIESESERCGPSEVRTYIVWSVIIRCGSSDGRLS